MTSDHFDPASNDSMFATILARLDAITQTLEENRCAQSECQDRFNSRITSLENEANLTRGKIIGASAVSGAVSGLIAWLGTMWAMRK